MTDTAEHKTATEIVNTGLIKAAESLSFFMKEKINLDGLEYCLNLPCDPLSNKNHQSNVYVLITEVIGEMKGVCCLLFNEDEANQLRQTALPAEIIENPEIMKEMADGILLEVDNIIAASVITRFSDILKIKIHGGVPSLKRMNKEELEEFIRALQEKNRFIINFNTHFVSSNLNFSPQFLWFFDESFANIIRNFTLTKNQLSSTG